MAGCGCEVEIKDREQSRVLVILLAINAVMFVVELVFGVLSQSTALIADSLDMLADATVYAIGLYAVGKAAIKKVNAAHLSGIFQMLLGVSVLIDVLRRWFYGSEPESFLMLVVGAVALVANIICVILISKHREGEVHMRASWIFSKNDVIANIGIIIAGALVYFMDSRYPDLIIGLLITLLVLRGGVLIVKDARQEKAKLQSAE